MLPHSRRRGAACGALDAESPRAPRNDRGGPAGGGGRRGAAGRARDRLRGEEVWAKRGCRVGERDVWDKEECAGRGLCGAHEGVRGRARGKGDAGRRGGVQGGGGAGRGEEGVCWASGAAAGGPRRC